MPVFYQQNINDSTRLAIWQIAEPEAFFLKKVPLQREITHPHKRLQHLAGRYLLQHLFPDFPYEQLRIAHTRQPFLPQEQYHFSISHCGNYAAAIISENKRVGIDIEKPTSRIINISPKFLHDSEKQTFNILQTSGKETNDISTIARPAHISPFLPTVLWSAKEAIYKWWSYGGLDFKSNMRLMNFDLAETGIIGGKFLKASADFDLQLHYKIFDEICLVWVLTELASHSK